MTEHHVDVVRLTGIEKHPNADSLSLVTVHAGYPVCLRTEDWKEGELAAYVPVDSVVPDRPEWKFLGTPGPDGSIREKDRRIKAKKLRGVFSMGLLAKPPEGAKEGDDVAEAMGIMRWEEPEPWQRASSGPQEPQWPAPPLACMPSKYDVEPFRRVGENLFFPGEAYVVTEKVHGQNFRAVFAGGALHVGSHARWVNPDPATASLQRPWAKVAERYGLEKKLAMYPGFVLFGESYGNNSDMPYGVKRQETGDALLAFDVWDGSQGGFLNWDAFLAFCRGVEVPICPVLAQGLWVPGDFARLLPLAEGKTTIHGAEAAHVREGFVIRARDERYRHQGRVQAKVAGEGYLTRKEPK